MIAAVWDTAPMSPAAERVPLSSTCTIVTVVPMAMAIVVAIAPAECEVNLIKPVVTAAPVDWHEDGRCPVFHSIQVTY